MVTTELDSFIQKFYRLWYDGHTAHLDLDTCAGKAWVGLRVQLGHAPGPLHQQQFHFRKKSFGPSRQRRRERRAATRVNIEQSMLRKHAILKLLKKQQKQIMLRIRTLLRKVEVLLI